jgi:hypothetical protein
MKMILCVFFILFLQSCVIKGLNEFTNEEQVYIESQSFYNDCEIFVDKDYDVIVNDSSNGHIQIRLEYFSSTNKLCLADSSEVAKIVLPFANGFEKVMDKRSKYDSLTIETSIMNQETEGIEFQTCGKYFDFNLNNMNSFKYREFVPNKK